MIIDSKDTAVSTRAISLVRRWRDLHPIEKRSEHGMAYHDETTAQRLNIVLTLCIAAQAVGDKEGFDYLSIVADETADLLFSSEFHGGINNHGMFQDISLRNYSIIATWRDATERRKKLEISCERLDKYFLQAFTGEGVHVENSPTYHLMVSRSLKQHVEVLELLEHPDSRVFMELLRNAAAYATNIVMPNGHFPPISDTTKGPLAGAGGDFFGDEFLYATSTGKRGSKPAGLSTGFKSSGYAIYRSDWDSSDATYLLFSAAYNNNYHKHSDDLSLILFAKNRELITEPGPYSYNYKDPFSRYAYSQFSHNNIVVDNKSVLRTDDKRSTVKINDLIIDDNNFYVDAETGRLNDTQHNRSVRVTGEARRESIRVTDRLYSETEHSYSQFWNIAAGLEVVLHGNGFEVFEGTEKLFDALITSVVPVQISKISGQTRPVLGWSFPKFGEKKPATVVRVDFVASNLEIQTEFNLENFSYLDRGLASQSANGWKSISAERHLNYLEVDNTHGDTSCPLVFVFSAMGLKGNFSYNYKSTLDKTSNHAIYVLDDFGDQGAYYLQEKNDRSIFRSVQKFVDDSIHRLASNGRPVYFVGSSKGGTAAMLHGLKYPQARIFVGAPQTRIGTFVEKPHPNILEYMTGGSGANEIAALDAVLYEQDYLKFNSSSVTIVVGKADHHYKNHVLPWAEAASEYGSKVDLIVKDGTPHSEIGKVYRLLLEKEIGNANTDAKEKNPGSFENSTNESARPRTWYDEVSGRIFASCPDSVGEVFAFRLYRDSELTKSKTYSSENYATWVVRDPGRYRVRFYTKNSTTSEISVVTGDWVFVM